MRRIIPVILINLFLVIIAFLLVYPFLLMVFGSFKSPIEFSANPGGLPEAVTFQNYYNLLVYNGGSMLRSYINSVFVTACYTVLSLAICSAAAFGFAKYRFPGRDLIFIILLSTMILPGELLIAPLYIMLSKIRMIDTYSVQIFPGIAGVFGMYLLRQNMLSIHDSIIEAARIDGAGEGSIFFRIGLPISSPALGAFCILNSLGKFNDYVWPVFMVNNPKKIPIMAVLPMLTTGESQSVFSKSWELIMAGCTVATIPLLVLFLCFQEKIMSSVTIGAVKE